MTELPITPEQLERLQQFLATDRGRQLMNLLQNRQDLRQAVKDYDSAGALARQLLEDPGIRALLKGLGG